MDEKEKLNNRIKEAVEKVDEDNIARGPSRNDLIEKAREKGVKKFRVLNKEELLIIVDPKTSKTMIDKVVAGAVKRWRS